MNWKFCPQILSDYDLSKTSTMYRWSLEWEYRDFIANLHASYTYVFIVSPVEQSIGRAAYLQVYRSSIPTYASFSRRQIGTYRIVDQWIFDLLRIYTIIRHTYIYVDAGINGRFTTKSAVRPSSVNRYLFAKL